MKIVKPLTLGVLHKPYRFQQQDRLCIAALGFFRLGADNERFLQDSQQWPLAAATLPPGQPLDEVMPKHYGEALLLGSAHAPPGKTVSEMCVRMSVGALDKRLYVVGDRSATGHRDVSRLDAGPFSAMPLTWERAYGGQGISANPAGCGYAGLWRKARGPLPNILYPQADMRRQPAGFGPIDLTRWPRRGKLGTYGRRWREKEAPGLAGDIDWSVFNLASPDQWCDGHFQGGEAYRLEGLHPSLPVIEGTLPMLHARAFVLDQGNPPELAREAPMRLDTVWFLPQHALGILIWHGEVAIADSDALDVAALMVGYEQRQQSRSPEHYQRVMGLRLAPETAVLHTFDESQLAAQSSPATLARKQMAQVLAETTLLARQQQMLDEMDRQFWQRSGMTPPAGHQAPRAELPPLGVVSTEAIAGGDVDFVAAVAKATTMAEQLQADGLARLEALQHTLASPTRPTPTQVEAQLAAALERAALPAYDLMPASETGRDPQLGLMLTALAQGRQAGQFADDSAYQRACEAVMKGPALKRQGRRAAPQSTLPYLPLMATNASQLGAQVLRWKASGICLAGRDLAGANLRGADLSGLDLREIMLEGADLSDASFVGANLQGAVLTGALLTGTDFSGADLGRANLAGSHGEAPRFVAADLSQAQAMSAQWPGANIDGACLDGLLAMHANLERASLRGVRAHAAVLLKAQAKGSQWQGAQLEKLIAMRADLRHADFSDAVLLKVVLVEAQLQGSIWSRARWDSVHATGKTMLDDATLCGMQAQASSLHGASLSGCDLRDGRFLRCDFGQSDMRGALLDRGIFSFSLFLQTDLRQASALDAEFFRALCRKTDLRGAQLTGANFLQAEMTGALRDTAREAA